MEAAEIFDGRRELPLGEMESRPHVVGLGVDRVLSARQQRFELGKAVTCAGEIPELGQDGSEQRERLGLGGEEVVVTGAADAPKRALRPSPRDRQTAGLQVVVDLVEALIDRVELFLVQPALLSYFPRPGLARRTVSISFRRAFLPSELRRVSVAGGAA